MEMSFQVPSRIPCRMKCHRVRSTGTQEDNPSSADTNAQGAERGASLVPPPGPGAFLAVSPALGHSPSSGCSGSGLSHSQEQPLPGEHSAGRSGSVLLLHPASSASHLPGQRKEVDGLCLRESSKGKAQEQAPEGPAGRGALPSRFYSQQAGNKTKPGPGAHQLHTQHSQTAEAASAKTQTLPAPALHTKQDLTKSIPTPEQNCQP